MLSSLSRALEAGAVAGSAGLVSANKLLRATLGDASPGVPIQELQLGVKGVVACQALRRQRSQALLAGLVAGQAGLVLVIEVIALGTLPILVASSIEEVRVEPTVVAEGAVALAGATALQAGLVAL